jgi:hypothetical protein
MESYIWHSESRIFWVWLVVFYRPFQLTFLRRGCWIRKKLYVTVSYSDDWIFLLTILGKTSWSNIIKRVKFMFSLISQLCLQLKPFSSPRAVICHALGATYSRSGPVMFTTYVSSVLWIDEFRSMEGTTLGATYSRSLPHARLYATRWEPLVAIQVPWC